jgi:hypothetical protein
VLGPELGKELGKSWVLRLGRRWEELVQHWETSSIHCLVTANRAATGRGRLHWEKLGVKPSPTLKSLESCWAVSGAGRSTGSRARRTSTRELGLTGSSPPRSERPGLELGEPRGTDRSWEQHLETHSGTELGPELGPELGSHGPPLEMSWSNTGRRAGVHWETAGCTRVRHSGGTWGSTLGPELRARRGSSTVRLLGALSGARAASSTVRHSVRRLESSQGPELVLHLERRLSST